MIRRAYATLTLKSADAAERVVSGICSNAETDRVGYIVEPMGARWKRLPLPFLWQHNHAEPIGHVEWLDARPDGIRFRGRLAQVDAPPSLVDRLETAWASIRAGLVRGISIGFRAIDVEPIATGIRFLEWELFEISSVTIPANQGATVTAVKAAAARRRLPGRVVRLGEAERRRIRDRLDWPTL